MLFIESILIIVISQSKRIISLAKWLLECSPSTFVQHSWKSPAVVQHVTVIKYSGPVEHFWASASTRMRIMILDPETRPNRQKSFSYSTKPAPGFCLWRCVASFLCQKLGSVTDAFFLHIHTR